MVEHLPLKEMVGGSSPPAPTQKPGSLTYYRHLWHSLG
ncbi:MAG: hypothetical protein UV56_C0018G0002 [Candidatus Woesebacteria bacterium GW2011_GWC1_43_10b]|uniref:Uncharacterized protein n=2 Tax=Candidatus Woeseibacteriota TaxID=1752722 RepID=A0A0G0LYP9_9BACT|nr:MAG: hypothetical protein UT23_C0038G0004 [Candidatus Woesebacteria bacterium GW2011_GWA1_39_12]KKS80411.1 MAG: hypothetical protein UV56_C0018G0002 [Candidatus Woesebacteria bacterium GW2011_GWC1_43_10b]